MKCEIIDYDHNGRGISKVDGKVIFIPNSIKGEIVDIGIVCEKKNYSIGKIKEIIKGSKARVKPLCPYFNACGGCDLMHMNYELQLEYKVNKIKNILKKYSNIDVYPEIVKSDKFLNYRNKLVLHKGSKGYGLFQKNSNDIIYIDECKIADERINKLLDFNSKEKEVTFRVCDKDVISNIFDKSDSIKTINGLKFNINVNSFFQVNDYICGKLFEEVSSNINNDDIVLDLYAGVGTLSILCAKKCKYVYSVEINKFASADAVKNVKLNNMNNIEVINGDAAKVVGTFDKRITKIIVDPPRSGLDKKTIEFLNNSNVKNIIYIACEPLSLARDINYLSHYKLSEIKIFDMFPNTYHFESVAVLERITNER